MFWIVFFVYVVYVKSIFMPAYIYVIRSCQSNSLKAMQQINFMLSLVSAFAFIPYCNVLQSSQCRKGSGKSALRSCWYIKKFAVLDFGALVKFASEATLDMSDNYAHVLFCDINKTL